MFRPDLIYAGIGSRKTPIDVCQTMTHMADYLADLGWTLRSGHADGADKAFERGAGLAKQIHLPWDGYSNTRVNGTTHISPEPNSVISGIAADHHPAWDRLSSSVKLLMCRNVTIILGPNLDEPARCVIGWTPNGEWVGGTSHGFRIAHAYGIPIFNIAYQDDRIRLAAFVDEASILPVAA